MPSRPKHNRADLMEWRGYHPPSRSKQGSSHGQYSQGQAAAAVQAVSTAAASATQSTTACRAAAPSLGRTSSVDDPLFVAHVRGSFHAADLLSLFRLGARRAFDHGQPYGPESAAHPWPFGPGRSVQLPPRLLEAPLVVVDRGADPGRADYWSVPGRGLDSPGGRRYRR